MRSNARRASIPFDGFGEAGAVLFEADQWIPGEIFWIGIEGLEEATDFLADLFVPAAFAYRDLTYFRLHRSALRNRARRCCAFL